MSHYRNPLLESYRLSIQFYDVPRFSINFYDAKDMTSDRLKVLNVVNEIMQASPDQSDQWLEKREKLLEKLTELKIESFVRLINSSQTLKLDSISQREDQYVDHASFVCLRLSVLNSHDETKIALHKKLEENLFAMKISTLNELEINQFFNYHGISHPKWCKPSPKEQADPYFTEYFNHYPDVSDPREFSLVRLKYLMFFNLFKIPLLDGKGYIPPKKMPQVLRGYFSYHFEQVSEDLEKMLQVLNKEDPTSTRFPELFRHMTVVFDEIMLDNNIEKNEISIDDIDKLAANVFPPCMRRIHDAFRAKHHLKHNGRRQYTLFLKGIGMKSDDTVKHFYEEFCTKGTVKPEQFKEYEYYIRHAYGEKGSHIDYNAKDCNYLIDQAHKINAVNDCHGCPLIMTRNIDDIEDFGKKMAQWNIPENYIKNIMSCVQEKHPRAACEQYFFAMNNCKPTTTINHPNSFFNQSIELQNSQFLNNSDKCEVSYEL